MPIFPGYKFPFQYHRPYNYPTHTPPCIPTVSNSKEENTSSKKTSNSKNTAWLELFGIKLYFDDILILSLLFFLYKEQVKDEGLFLVLLMLLIT